MLLAASNIYKEAFVQNFSLKYFAKYGLDLEPEPK